jgi:hypothetical protein
MASMEKSSSAMSGAAGSGRDEPDGVETGEEGGEGEAGEEGVETGGRLRGGVEHGGILERLRYESATFTLMQAERKFGFHFLGASQRSRS